MFSILLAISLFSAKHPLYSSGVREVEHSYSTDKPAITSPLLTIDTVAFDGANNLLQPGIYAVELTPDHKTMLFIQGNRIVGKNLVTKVIKLREKYPVPEAKIGFIRDNKIFITYKKEKIEAYSFLYK